MWENPCPVFKVPLVRIAPIPLLHNIWSRYCGIRLLDAHEAAAVDVREPDEFAVGHIPGAKLLPLGDVLTRAEEVMPDKNAQWLIYCRTGRRSADAVQKLESLGYTNLRDLGGILSWPYEIEGDFEGHF